MIYLYSKYRLMKNFICFFLLFAPFSLWAQEGFRIAEFNTENFFDYEHDSLKNDEMFLPGSLKNWTRKRFWTKMQNISKEIISLGKDAPADLVALTEVENDSVMTCLTQRALLRRAGYRYIMTNSEDHRGIDVALLYQPGTFRPLSHNSIRVDFKELPKIRTRDILYVQGVVYTGDTLHVFVCHLSSKLGGRKATERYRMVEAHTIRTHVDSIFDQTADAKIIILGDFNETDAEDAIAIGLKVQRADRENILTNQLYNLSYIPENEYHIRGTYKYNDTWEFIDHIIVSGSLLNPENTISTSPESFHVHTPKFILQKDEKYKGCKPFKTYNGYKYLGGFSDHLPIYIDLKTSLP